MLAAEDGNAKAQSNLGVMYAEGIGVSEDINTAYRWWNKSARLGNAGAQFNLALMYAKGDGVEQDSETAHMWFLLSAGGGYSDAEIGLERLKPHMTRQQIQNSLDRARTCNNSNYEKCE